jgi:hypothetical protein
VAALTSRRRHVPEVAVRHPVLLCSLVGFIIAADLSVADWPHVRGPAYDGRSAETGFADQWPAEGPPVLWARDLGPGYSGFVVAAGRAFTLFQTNTGIFVVAPRAVRQPHLARRPSVLRDTDSAVEPIGPQRLGQRLQFVTAPGPSATGSASWRDNRQTTT